LRFVDTDRHAGVGGAHLAQQPGERVDRQCGKRHDLEATDVHPADVRRQRRQLLAGGREPRRPPGPHEQRHAELALEPGDGLRERGLRHVRGGGASREPTVVDGREEVLELADVHRASLWEICERSIGPLTVLAGCSMHAGARDDMTLLWVALVGAGIGLLGGMFGKGGSAVATPLLHAFGVPAIIAVGIPATIAGAVATRWIDGGALVKVTDVVLVGLGARFAVPQRKRPTRRGDAPRQHPAALAAVATVVGVASGLLANSGGFLLAPLYVAVLRRPIKVAFASSLAVA